MNMTTAQIINIVLGVLAVVVTFISYYFYIKSVINKAATDAVNDAEKDGKTGEEKLSLAIDQVYAIVPAILKPILTKDFIKALVQSAFDKIEAYAKKQADKKKKG